ncbi:MAG: hypothetical protein NZ843_01285 [Fimbriimonadales bacterium]|nr:hypothetical protein [Fimbriimonadales bacterium]
MRIGFLSVGVSPTPLRSTGFQPVRPCTDSRVRASSVGRRRDGLDNLVQATLCLGETPKPRASFVSETPTLRMLACLNSP